MTSIASERELLSAVIGETLGDEVVTAGELTDRVAPQGFGLLMIVLSLPAIIPVLPGRPCSSDCCTSSWPPRC